MRIHKEQDKREKDEWWGWVYSCPECKGDEIWYSFNFCPACGKEIIWELK